MLQELPLEILSQIADFIPLQEAGEFARTCHKCYFAVLPHIWHHLSLTNTVDLKLVAKRLESNSIWAQRAMRFVRVFSLIGDEQQQQQQQIDHIKFSSILAASMFGITSSPDEQAAEEEQEVQEMQKITPHERIGTFGKRLLELFPNLSNLVFDYTEAVRNFYSATAANTTTNNITEQQHLKDGNQDDDDENGANARLPFFGSFSLVNYRSDHSKFMHYLLTPFRCTRHLKVETLPVVSLCDDMDESILTNADLLVLSTLGLTYLRKLELSYLDSDLGMETMQELLASMPNLNELELKWIFPPNKGDFDQLCQVVQHSAHLYPTQIHKTPSIYQVHFILKQEEDKK